MSAMDRRPDPAGGGVDVSAATTSRFACSVCRAIYRGDFQRCPRDGGAVVAFDPDDDPLLGATLAGRYVVEALLGEGGMGRVYRARHHELTRLFAIKILFGELAALSDMRARFRLEAEAASRLDHPNVVSVIDVGETDEGLLYLAMDHVAGRELRTILDEEAPLAPERAAALARRLCRGLQHAHDRGMVHRDFKPENVLVVDEAGVEVPRIADFGLAVLTEDRQEGGRLTGNGEVLGTPPYMSPEQLGGGLLDVRSDLFSLGVVLYEMLAGVPPHEGNPFEVARKTLSEPCPAMSERAPGVDVAPELERVARRLLEKRPEDRYASAAEVIAVLDTCFPAQRTRTRPTTAPPAGEQATLVARASARSPSGRRSARPELSGTGELLALVTRRRRPVLAIAAATAALLVAAVVASILLRGRGDEEEPVVADAETAPVPVEGPASAALPPSAPVEAPAPVTAPQPQPTAVPELPAAPPPGDRTAHTRPDTRVEPQAPRASLVSASSPEAPDRPAARRRPDAGIASRVDALHREGNKLYLGGNLPEARKKFQAALLLNARYAPAHRGLGFVYQRLGDKARARKHLGRYLELAPEARDAATIRARMDALGR